MTEPHDPYRPPEASVAGVTTASSDTFPWESRNQLGFFEALKASALMLVQRPADAFRSMMKQGDFGSPILWAVLFMTVFGFIGQIWGLLFNVGISSLMPGDFGGSDMAFATGFGVIGLLASIFILPIAALLSCFIGGGILHLCAMITGCLTQSRAGFEGTVRVVGYSSIANIVQVVPILGGLVYMFWWVYLMVVGVREVHGTTTGRALAAVLMPLVVCCGLYIGVLVLVFGAIGLSGLNQG
jgi:hypothetical protein